MITKFRIYENSEVSPEIGSIVKHTGWSIEFPEQEYYPADVWIVDGKYLSNGRVSNFWYWQRVLDDGSLGEMENGYGSFKYSDIVEYRVWTKDEIKKIYPIKKSMAKYNL